MFLTVLQGAVLTWLCVLRIWQVLKSSNYQNADYFVLSYYMKFSRHLFREFRNLKNAKLKGRVKYVSRNHMTQNQVILIISVIRKEWFCNHWNGYTIMTKSVLKQAVVQWTLKGHVNTHLIAIGYEFMQLGWLKCTSFSAATLRNKMNFSTDLVLSSGRDKWGHATNCKGREYVCHSSKQFFPLRMRK